METSPDLQQNILRDPHHFPDNVSFLFISQIFNQPGAAALLFLRMFGEKV